MKKREQTSQGGSVGSKLKVNQLHWVMLPETGVVVSVTSTKSPRMPLATIEMIFPARKVMYGQEDPNQSFNPSTGKVFFSYQDLSESVLLQSTCCGLCTLHVCELHKE